MTQSTYHAVCLAMFIIGGVKSKGKLNGWAALCTLGLALEAALWTGLVNVVVRVL